MRNRVFPLSKVYGLLETGPVVLLTTSRNGRPNIMTMSWHTMIDFDPPIIGCVISSRNHSFSALKATRECVINIPTAELAPEVVGCGNHSGRTMDKFAVFGLTPSASSCVAPPGIAECYANLECRVIDTTLVRRYGFFILEVLKAWIDPSRRNDPQTLHHRGKGAFMIAGKTIKLPSRMK
jgi:flavin reductase (DIM6/NTAB) family NADH-FMN oxidoreductase RutF